MPVLHQENLQPFRRIQDQRGCLQIVDPLPFDAKRFFLIENVPFGQKRGNHAHRSCQQLLCCLSGTFSACINDGRSVRCSVLMSGYCLHLPPLHWVELYNFSETARCLVLASEPYDADEMIFDREEFREITSDSVLRSETRS